MSRMLDGMDIEQVRAALESRRGEWSKIATAAGVNRKTVWRIMVDPQYLPTLRTLRALARALTDGSAPDRGAERVLTEAA